MIAQQKRRDLLAGFCNSHHVLHEVVVGIAFIGKAHAVARHRDHAGFGAVDEMRHHALAAVLARGDRHRHPGRGVGQCILGVAAGGFRQPQSVAGVADRAGRIMLIAGRGVRKHRLAPRHIMRKAAAGEDHAALCINANLAPVALDDGAAHRAVVADQFAHRRRQPQRDLQIERRFGEPSGQRIAVGEVHAAAMANHVDEMLRQPLGDEQRRGQRFRRAHEMHDLLAGAQHHAEHGEFGQGTRRYP